MTIGNCLEGMNKYEKALEYYNKAIIVLKNLKKLQQYSDLKNQPHNYIARIYQKQNLHQKAITYLTGNVNFNEVKKSDLRTYSYLINTIQIKLQSLQGCFPAKTPCLLHFALLPHFLLPILF